MNTETRQFGLHKDIIFKLITDQTGSLAKALGELVQNSYDAAGTAIHIDLKSEGFVARDDGKGFVSRHEIEQFFETFGTPHDDTESRKKIGMYRIGRGQIMGWASTVWESQAYTMDVDIKHRGLDYTLTEHPENLSPGCSISGTFYTPLLPSELYTVTRELSELVAFVAIPVFINGKRVNELPQERKDWTHETDKAFIKLKDSGGLKIYNLGIFVCELSSHYYGVGGTVVSKEALQVNFARNAVLQNQCAIWKDLVPFLKSESLQRNTAKGKRLNDESRTNLCRGLLNGEIDYNRLRDAKLVRDVRGYYHSLDKLSMLSIPLTVAPKDKDKIGIAVHQRKLAFVLSPKTLEWFDVSSPADLLCAVANQVDSGFTRQRLLNVRIEDFSASSTHVGGNHIVLDEKEMDKVTVGILRSIRKSADSLQYRIQSIVHGSAGLKARQIKAGQSDVASCWTDGRDFISINETILKQARTGMAGFYRIAQLIADQCVFTANTIDHDLSTDELELSRTLLVSDASMIIAEAAESMFRAYVDYLKLNNLTVIRPLAKSEDTIAKMDAHSKESFPAIALN